LTNKRPPVIGITCIEIEVEEGRRPPRLGQNQSYLRALIGAGAAPLLIPHLTDRSLLRALFGLLDGLLLPGGEDIDPAHFAEAHHEKLGRVSPDRDETELTLTRWAVEEGLPLLAICRGIQVLNVALGGSLYQDIQAQIPRAQRHDWYPGFPRDHLSHPVEIVADSQLARITDTTSLWVNSLHHQVVKDVAPGLTIVARAPDQLVEAVEAPDHPFAIGVQWHPEELVASSIQAQRLFDALIAACRA
jgi:putative glutamine amidotransferase